MANSKHTNTDIYNMQDDLLEELDSLVEEETSKGKSLQEALRDKKIGLHVHDEKIGVNNEFVLVFVDNLLNQLVNGKITLTEQKVLLGIVSLSQYRNVFNVTQAKIAKKVLDIMLKEPGDADQIVKKYDLIQTKLFF